MERAFLLQLTLGISTEINRIRDIYRQHNLFLSEDDVHALGSFNDGKHVGSWADEAIFSTKSSNMISTDRGGLLVTFDAVLASKIEHLYWGLK